MRGLLIIKEEVKIENLTKIFGGKVKEVESLIKKGSSKAEILKKTGSTVGVSNASFSVKNGEIFVIMGLSGSGKSTLIRMIDSLIKPTLGKIIIDGRNIDKLNKEELRKERATKMSMVFQNFALFPHRTILENAAFGLEVQKKDKNLRNKKAHQALEEVGLHGYDDHYPQELSGGQQQRVGLARALANGGNILLMDEAFSALDPLTRTDMQDQLLDLESRLHKTVIFISHDLNESLRLGDRIMIMNDGKVSQIGTPEEILTHPADAYVEKFIQGVDRTKVLTAKNVMIRSHIVNLDKQGPRVALERMRANQLSSLFAVNNKRQLIGLVDAKGVAKLVENNSEDLKSVVNKEIPTVSPDTPLTDLMSKVSDTPVPFAVIDSNKKLLGIIIRSSILGAISGREVKANV